MGAKMNLRQVLKNNNKKIKSQKHSKHSFNK